MEPGIKELFKRLALSMSLLIVWMMVNATAGIKYGYAFFEGNIHLGNIVFYVWMITSLGGLVFLCLKIWKKPIEDL